MPEVAQSHFTPAPTTPVLTTYGAELSVTPAGSVNSKLPTVDFRNPNWCPCTSQISEVCPPRFKQSSADCHLYGAFHLPYLSRLHSYSPDFSYTTCSSKRNAELHTSGVSVFLCLHLLFSVYPLLDRCRSSCWHHTLRRLLGRHQQHHRPQFPQPAFTTTCRPITTWSAMDLFAVSHHLREAVLSHKSVQNESPGWRKSLGS